QQATTQHDETDEHEKAKRAKGNLKLFLFLAGAGCLTIFFTIALLVVAITPKENYQIEPQPQIESLPEMAVVVPTSYQIGETFTVGYLEYNVTGIRWTKTLSNGIVDDTANARFLVVNMEIKNL